MVTITGNRCHAENEIETLNKEFGKIEQIKEFILLADEWSTSTPASLPLP
jgi:hypothetical protein